MIGALLAKLLLAARLATAIAAAHPELAPARVASASLAIVAEHGAHDVLLVAGVAIHESMLDWRAVNAGGCWGAMQVCGRRPGRWTERQSYAAGVRKLDEAAAWCAGCSTLQVMAVYASGPRGARERLYRMPRAILAERDRLRARIGGRPGVAPAGGPTS